jgi:transposase
MNADGKLPSKEVLSLPEYEMSQRSKVCGVDVHKQFFVAALLSQTGGSIIKRFLSNKQGLLEFKEWVLNEGCELVALESTGVYWYSLYSTLEDHIEVMVANPYFIKNIPGRKTDIADAQWIAQFALNNLIKPSRIFPKKQREIRNLTRSREHLVNNRTMLKNRIHRVLESASIKLSSVLADIFGKSGLHIVQGLLAGTDLDTIIASIPHEKVRAKEPELRNAIQHNLESSQIIIIDQCLSLMEQITSRIDELDEEIGARMNDRKKDLEIATSIPGIGKVSAMTILAEIGSYEEFVTPEKLAAWSGLIPSIYQSADHLKTGPITKRGSPHLRRIMVEVAQAAVKTKNCRLRSFFLRLKMKKGYNKAIVAVARKILCILWTILKKRELYCEENLPRKKVSISLKSPPTSRTIQEAIEILGRAGYMIQKLDSNGG